MPIGHYDPHLTRMRRAHGEFTDRRSKVYVRKDGSLRIRLFGRDKSNLRDDCFARDRYKCMDPDSMPCDGKLEMSHNPPISNPDGSDELDKVETRCTFHHSLFDHHSVKWSKP